MLLMDILTLFTYRFEALSGSEAVLEVTLFITIFHQHESHQYGDIFSTKIFCETLGDSMWGAKT